jgi:hypothetical protein
MTRYLEVKPGSIAEVAIRLRDDYQAYFKKELEKAGKGIAQMSDAEKKAFFNRVDKAYNAKNEAKEENEKTTLVAKPGDKEEVKRIPVDKLADYKKQGWVEAESFVPEQAKNPYAIGMAAAMKATGDKPPLKKSTITKAHDIADKIKKEEIETISEEEQEKEYEAVTEKGKIKVKATNAYEASKKAAEHFGLLPQWKKMTNVVKVSPIKEEKDPVPLADLLKLINKEKEKLAKEKETKKEEVEITEGQYKEIDTRKGDLKLAKDKKQALKDKYNAIMANQASGDEQAVADQIRKLDMSIKKQEQELIDIMKKGKEDQKNEAVDPERVQKLNQKIASMTTKVGELDKSKPENKTKEAILKSDIATAKLRLQDLMQKSASAVKKAVNEVSKAKQSYKTLKMSLKKEQEVNNNKKTLTDKPITKIEVNPKIEG